LYGFIRAARFVDWCPVWVIHTGCSELPDALQAGP
jgi:hypothetical protein